MRPQAAEFHRLVAMRAYYAGDAAAAAQAFRAAQLLEPGYELPTKVAEEGSELREVWREVRRGWRPKRVDVGQAAGLEAWVDAKGSETRPLELPSIVQLGTADGQVGWTGYLAPGTALPGQPGGSALSMVPFAFIRSGPVDHEDQRWGLPLVVELEPEAALASEPAPLPEPTADPVAEEPGDDFVDNPLLLEPTTPAQPSIAELPAPVPAPRGDGLLLAGAIASGVGAAALYGTAHVTRWRFDHNGPTQGLMRATNGSLVGAAGLGLTSATLTTVIALRRSK